MYDFKALSKVQDDRWRKEFERDTIKEMITEENRKLINSNLLAKSNTETR